MRMRGTCTVVALALLAAACSMTIGHEEPPATTIVSAEPTHRGREEFVRACASCHGLDGRGGGPVVAALRMPPPDLTTLAARTMGRFPRERVIAVVTGEMPEAAHGTRELPVWAERFNTPPGAADPASVATRERLESIVSYLESIQRPSR